MHEYLVSPRRLIFGARAREILCAPPMRVPGGHKDSGDSGLGLMAADAEMSPVVVPPNEDESGGGGSNRNGSASTSQQQQQQHPPTPRPPQNFSSNWVLFNVGGKTFQTSRQTLHRDENSLLARLADDRAELASERDVAGAILIDRDPAYFSPVLNYLRHGRLIVDPGVAVEGVLEEAEFYNLPRLVQLCHDRIVEDDEKKTRALEERDKKTEPRHVYRVLQCHEDELTNVVSAMSEGWKFEQLLNIGPSSASYVAEQPAEYLCVVSRACHEPAKTDDGGATDRAKLLQTRARQH